MAFFHIFSAPAGYLKEKALAAYRMAREAIEHIKTGLQRADLQKSLASFSLIRRVYELSEMD